MGHKQIVFALLAIVGMLSMLIKPQESNQSSPGAVTSLRDDFNSLDSNQDGYVDVHELRTAMSGISEDDISAFFDMYDADRDGVLSQDEYLTVSTSK
jgi:Ca2+-binding EF-hand superfamily protein